MRQILRTNNAVVISAVGALLDGAGIHHLVLDQNMSILEGTLYPLLTRLKNAEMLTYRWEESNSGPPRKYFSLTEKGEAFYRELEQTWIELSNAVNTLTKKEEQPNS